MSGVIAAPIRPAGSRAKPADPERRMPIACGQPRHGSARMPKSLREYSADDWRHLRPVTQAVKSLRLAPHLDAARVPLTIDAA
jgi:hypothetical protein